MFFGVDVAAHVIGARPWRFHVHYTHILAAIAEGRRPLGLGGWQVIKRFASESSRPLQGSMCSLAEATALREGVFLFGR